MNGESKQLNNFTERLSYKLIDQSYAILEKYYNQTGSDGKSFF